MKEEKNYFQGLFAGIKTLCVGLKTTMRELFVRKITEQYPENRDTLTMFDRFRGSLTMPHNADNEHKCIGCGLCQTACPNGTISVKTQMVETEDGKKKKQLVEYRYNLGCCMFCQLCTRVCPQGAITFDQTFENAVFDRTKLIRVLNRPGSKCEEKKRPAAAAPKAAAGTGAESGIQNGAAQPKATTQTQ